MSEENEELKVEPMIGSSFCPICGYFIAKRLKDNVAFHFICPKCEKSSSDMFIDYGSETHRIYWKEFVETGLLFYGAWLPPPAEQIEETSLETKNGIINDESK
jgi:transposase-like protein